MAGFDYDVATVGSGFGGSVAALHAAEKGYRVAVMEAGPRWPDKKLPKSQWDLGHFMWFPALEPLNIYAVQQLDGDIQVRL
jgi:cholesterol oxidase